MADLCQSYGSGVLPHPLPYPTFVQLTLNLDRTIWRTAYSHYLALQMDKNGLTPDCLKAVGLSPRDQEDTALRQAMDVLIAEHSRF